MSQPKKYLKTERGKHRLHDSLNVICILVESIVTAVHYSLGEKAAFKQGDCVSVNSNIAKMSIVLPLFGPVRAALQDTVPASIEIELKDSAEPEPLDGTEGFGTVLIMAISPVFVDFFERHREWLETILGKRENWPPILNFVSAVRNAISHDGRIHFVNKNPARSEWRGLSYSYPDNGRKVINEEIFFGDMLLLLFDMSDELDRLGCPLSP